MAAPDNIISNVHHEMPGSTDTVNPKHMAATPPLAAYGVTVTPGANNLLEYVSGRPNPRIARYIEATPQWIDDLTRDLGTDLYERMMTDAQCYSCLETVRLAVMAEGWKITPAIDDKKAPDYSIAKEFAEFCERNTEYMAQGSMPGSFWQWCYEMLEAVALGNKVAEKVCQIEESGKDAGRMILRRLKTKDRKTFSFVVDAFLNVLGLIAVIPGRSYIIYQGTSLFDPDKLPNIIPRDKFCVFTYNPRHADPRGSSIFRAAYDPWWTKQAAKRELLKWIAQFGSPPIYGIASEESTAQAATDPLGNPTGGVGPNQQRITPQQLSTGVPAITPEQALLAAVNAIKSGAGIALPPGSQIGVLQTSAEAQIVNAIEYYDKQISKAITSQILATEEGEHQARAAAQDHRDILDMVASHTRYSLQAMIRRDLFHYLIRYNWGEMAAKLYTPKIEFGKTVKEDWPQTVSGVSSLVSCGWVAPNQVAALDTKLGLPDRGDEKSKMQIELEATQQQIQQQAQQQQLGAQGGPMQGAPGASGSAGGRANPQPEAAGQSQDEQGNGSSVGFADIMDRNKLSRAAHVNAQGIKCGRAFHRSFLGKTGRRVVDRAQAERLKAK